MTALAKHCPICGTRYDGAATFCQKDGAKLTSEQRDPFVGRVILDQFRIEEPIGAGGMGTVYRAHQTTLDRHVAVKILHPELASNPDATRRFHREARVATSLEHPNLVRVFLFGELPEDGSLYLVMEYLRGRSLTQALKTEGALPVPRALHVATQIAEAVGMAHARGIVHRDVKPENVMLVERRGDRDFVKVLDFGIARLLWDDATHLTQSGVIFGTARYISPEGAAGEETDARSDVYSIGVLTYQLLTGVTPFEAQTPVAMLMKHIHDQAPPLRSMGAGRRVPQPVADVVQRALAKNPDMRWDDAGQMADALREAAEHCAVPLPRASWAPRASTLPPARGRRDLTPTAPVPLDRSERSVDTSMQVPGLSKRPRWTTMLAAFVLGAAAVVGGVMLLKSRGQAEQGPLTELAGRARTALQAGHLDAPPGENVLELTARMLEQAPRNAEARAIRREAVLTLREQAARARAGDELAEAKRAWQRVLVFTPGDPQAVEAIREIETAEAQARAPEPGLRLTPEEVRVGETSTFLAVVDGERAVGEDAHFELWRGRRRLRRVPAVRAGDEKRWVGSYTWRAAATYEVRFVMGAGEDALELEETQRVQRRSARLARDDERPRTTLRPTP
ncbi:MAG TPA: protein kinase, partial [Polyangiaceae bacterium LLY-WYZ-15_(1-7)]|nr:protein kinase [Polyangiaceae bacterium LLY-WYZ-15_(1-7)]